MYGAAYARICICGVCATVLLLNIFQSSALFPLFFHSKPAHPGLCPANYLPSGFPSWSAAWTAIGVTEDPVSVSVNGK